MQLDNTKDPCAVKHTSPLLAGITKSMCFALAVSAVPTIGLLSATPASAQSTPQSLYNGGKARVNRSASLRSLTEAVAAASCRVDGGIDAEATREELSAFSDEFSAIIDGLVNGSAILGMPGAEERGRTLQALSDTSARWAPVNTAAERLSSGSGTDADAMAISDGYKDLFEETENLAALVSGQYADPQQLLQSDATVLNFAIRQRALAYRMARAMCELATGTASSDTQAELQTTIDLFQQTHIALRDGFPPAGINAPPNDAVRTSLEATFEIWQGKRSIFDAALAGQTPSADDVVTVTSLSEALSVAMNNSITLYLIATPGQDGVYRVPLEAYAQTELATWLTNPELIAAINAQNAANADLSDDAVIALDQQWRAEAGAGGGPMIEQLLSAPVSEWLQDRQVATAGFVTEIFIMYNKGLNVAQSVETSDYWQGDEAKWQQTYSVGPNALHISEVEFDDSTGFYQSQASIAISDPSTGRVIGAVTFGINVQNLM